MIGNRRMGNGVRKTAAGRDAIPLYHQIYLALRDEILSGERGFGEMLPTEHDLTEQYAVSRITARRALDELAQHGMVERRRRTGTRVCFRSPVSPIEGHVDQAVESLIAFGHGTRVRVLELGEVAADPAIAERLDLAEGAPVLRALRLRLTDDAPLGAIESFVPSDIGLPLDRESLTRQPMLQLIRESGHVIGAGEQTISAISADPLLAELIETEARAPIIQIERVVRSQQGRPLLFTCARYRGDRYRLTLDLHGASPSVSANTSASG